MGSVQKLKLQNNFQKSAKLSAPSLPPLASSFVYIYFHSLQAARATKEIAVKFTPNRHVAGISAPGIVTGTVALRER
jgi:hypothetical protein